MTSPLPKSPTGEQRRLLNSIVNVCLVYGFDETCECDLVIEEEDSEDVSLDNICERKLNIRFLQIIAPGKVYPERQTSTGSTCDSRGEQNGVESSISGLPSPTHSNKKFDVRELGLDWENVENRHHFLFPEQSKMYNDISDFEPSVVPMMFTNLEGDHSYGVGLRFLRPYYMEKKKNCRYCCLTPWTSDMVPTLKTKLVYLPMCCCLLSAKPYFQFMKQALSGFYQTMSDNDDVDFWCAIREFSERVFLVPTPPPGMLSISASLPGFSSKVIIRPPRGNKHQDIRLNYPFTCLGVDNVLQVITAFLTEQKMMFVSSSYSLLTYTVNCFLSYISPMHWRYAVAPILPAQLLDCLNAPFPIIAGFHPSLLLEEEVVSADNLVIVNLDEGSVTCRNLDPPLAPLPRNAVDKFKQRYCELEKTAYSLAELRKLSVLSAEAALKEREDFDYQYDETLSTIFLELMVNLYNEMTQELLQSRVKFEEAVRLMNPEDQDFYKQIESTDMFSAFCQSRRQCTDRDEFTLLAEHLKRVQRASKSSLQGEDLTSSVAVLSRPSTHNLYQTQRHTIQHPSLVYNRYTSTSMKRSHSSSVYGGPTSLPVYSDSREEGALRHSPLSLPNQTSVAPPPMEPIQLDLPCLGSKFISRENFIDGVNTLLDGLAESNVVKAQCLYLKAFYNISQNEIIAGLDVLFDTLQRLDVNLVPDRKHVQGVLDKLSPYERELLSQKTYYKHIVPSKRRSISVSTRGASSTYNLDKKMPTKPLNLNDFLKLVRQNAIAEDAETATNLHRLLSHGLNTNISPDVFRAFYESWKTVHEVNSIVELPMIELEKEDKASGKVPELVLAVAEGVRTNFGSSCTIVLTTFRLLVVASFKTHVMADLRTPLLFENISYSLMIGTTRLPGIRFEKISTGHERPKSTVGNNLTKKRLRNATDTYMAFQASVERDHWYHIIKELQVGWQLSQARRDPSVMTTANSHIILQTAIHQGGFLDNSTPAQRVKLALKLLSFQSKDVSEVSKDTVDNLQYRINPCLHETERQTVESLLYIPPMDFYDEEMGKLWIGLGNGRLKVYDIEAKCFECDIKITESRHGKSVRLNCLLSVGQHVWVGSHSRNIHILDAQTVTHVSQISYLEEAPKDLLLNENGSLVWGLLLNGVLLAWDPETRTRVRKIQVPIPSVSSSYTACTCFTIWRNYIWVGTNRGSITVMDTETGEKDHEIFFPGSRRQIEIKHLALSSEQEIWCSVYCVPKTKESTFVAVFDPSSKKKVMQYSELDSRVSIILPVDNTMWCGTKHGKIYIFHSQSYANEDGMPKVLSAHEDNVRTMTMTDINLVVSGGGSSDGYAAVWKTLGLS